MGFGPGPGDFDEQLYAHEAGQAKNAFPGRYGGQIGRPGAPAPPLDPLEERVEFFLHQLMRSLLLRNPGIHVREPSHHASPFFAQQWSFFLPTTALTVAEQVFAVPINGNAAVPQGMLGVVSYAFVTVDERSAGIVVGAADFTLWRLMVNGQTVPGFGSLRPWAFQSHWVNDAPPTVFDIIGAANGFPGPCPVPIKLRGGDVVTLGISSTAVIANARATVLGYFYPPKQDADGIRGTIVDTA